MEIASPCSPLVIAVVEENPADVSYIARVLQAHGLPYVLRVLESRQRALHFFDQLAAQDDVRCPDLLLLDFTLPLAWTPESCCNGLKLCPYVDGCALS